MATAATPTTNPFDTLSSPATTSGPVYLTPRPYERQPGILVLLPLLPPKKPRPTLPEDVWRQIFEYVVSQDLISKPSFLQCHSQSGQLQKRRRRKVEHVRSSWGLTLVCKLFNVSCSASTLLKHVILIAFLVCLSSFVVFALPHFDSAFSFEVHDSP